MHALSSWSSFFNCQTASAQCHLSKFYFLLYQVQATNEVLDRSALKNDQLPDVTDCAANNLTNPTNVPGNETGEFVLENNNFIRYANK